MTKSKNIYLILGNSGSGKSTISGVAAEMLKRVYPDKNIILESYTTRSPRYPGEVGHTFVSKEEFDKLDLIAYTKFGDYEYGATKEQIDDALIYIIDENGYEELIHQAVIDKGIKAIKINTSPSVAYRRMLHRGEDKTEADKRRVIDEDRTDDNIKYDLIISGDDQLTFNAEKLVEFILKEEKAGS